MFTGAKFSVVDCRAVSISSADSTALAWVLALSINAGKVWWAVVVSSAAHSAMGKLADTSIIAVIIPCALRWRQNFDTVVFRISSVVRKAGTDSVMVDGLADGVDAASPINTARVLADVSDAYFEEWTVLIVAAARNAVAMAANASNSTVIVLEAGAWLSNLFAFYLWIPLET